MPRIRTKSSLVFKGFYLKTGLFVYFIVISKLKIYKKSSKSS